MEYRAETTRSTEINTETTLCGTSNEENPKMQASVRHTPIEPATASMQKESEGICKGCLCVCMCMLCLSCESLDTEGRNTCLAMGMTVS